MHIIGIDLGGTQLRMRLVSADGTIIDERRYKHKNRKPAHIVARIADEIKGFCQTYELAGPLQISFAVAAMLDPGGTIVQSGPNLGWTNVPLVELLQQELTIPHTTRLLNDLDAAAFGEFVAGAGKESQHLACVFVGSGVGCGLIINGKLYTGASRIAGEFGHIKVVPHHGRLCGCGAHGCLEAYTGGHNLATIAQEIARKGTSAFLKARAISYANANEPNRTNEPNNTNDPIEKGSSYLTAADLEDGAAANDPVCFDLWQKTASLLGIALSNLLTLLNPDCLILGGGVLSHSPILYKAVLQHMQQHTNPAAWQAVSIHAPKLGDDAGLIGAIAQVSD